MRITKTSISIDNLRFYANHGVMEQEKITGGTFLVSLVVHGDFSKACIFDDVEETVNYAKVFELTKKEMSIHSDLIENVAYRIAQRILNEITQAESVSVKVTKTNPPMGAQCSGASITLEANRNDTPT